MIFLKFTMSDLDNNFQLSSIIHHTYLYSLTYIMFVVSKITEHSKRKYRQDISVLTEYGILSILLIVGEESDVFLLAYPIKLY